MLVDLKLTTDDLRRIAGALRTCASNKERAAQRALLADLPGRDEHIGNVRAAAEADRNLARYVETWL